MTKTERLELAIEFRRVASLHREHRAVTWEHGVKLVNLLGEHGDVIANALADYDDRIKPAPMVGMS